MIVDVHGRDVEWKPVTTTTSAPLPNPASDASAVLQMIAAASSDPRVDIEKMRELKAMHLEILKYQAESAFTRDMQAAQEAMKPIVKDAVNRQQGSTYALLGTIDRQIRPVYTSHGFAMTFNTGEPRQAGAVRMICQLRHIAGHVANYELEGALDLTGDKGSINKSPIKAVGSTNSYLRRYLIMNVWNLQLTDDDDDGDATSALRPEQLSNVLNMLNACDIAGDRLQKFLVFADASSVEQIQRHRYADVMTKLRSVHRERMGRG